MVEGWIKMQKKKICKKCHNIYEPELKQCPICKNQTFSTSAKGRVFIFNANKSSVAEKMGINTDGEYAIKI